MLDRGGIAETARAALAAAGFVAASVALVAVMPPNVFAHVAHMVAAGKAAATRVVLWLYTSRGQARFGVAKTAMWVAMAALGLRALITIATIRWDRAAQTRRLTG